MYNNHTLKTILDSRFRPEKKGQAENDMGIGSFVLYYFLPVKVTNLNQYKEQAGLKPELALKFLPYSAPNYTLIISG